VAGDDNPQDGAPRAQPAAQGPAPGAAGGADVAAQVAVPEPPAPAAGPGQDAGAPLAVEIVPPGQGLIPGNLPDALATINTVNDSAAMILLRVSVRALETDRIESRASINELQQELRRVEKELANANKDNAVLSHQVEYLRHSDSLRGALKTIGGIIFGAGFSAVARGAAALAFAVFAIGLAFVIAGWKWPIKSSGSGGT